MRDQRSCPDEPIRLTTAEEDRRTRHSVLIAVIDLHPAPVTVSELIRQLTRTSEDFGECDAIEQAVIDLAGFGLLHRHDFRKRPDAFVTPTQAALCAYELLSEEED
jgi:hypothetical protein